MGSPNSLGDLRLSYDTLMIEPTTCLAGLVISLTSLVVLSKRPGRSREDAWGLELNLLLDHIQGFKELRRQHTPSPYSLRYVLQIVTDWYSIAKARLLEFKPIRVSVGEAAIGFLEMPLGNSPAGQKAWLAGTNRQVEVINQTFNPPISPEARYPSGYVHDLSIIRGFFLPEITCPPGYPVITGLGSYPAALDGGPMFVIGLNALTRVWRQLEGRGISKKAQECVARGSQCLCDSERCNVGLSILRRTQYDPDSAQGFSGSVLCLGKTTDQTALALCFQNFEGPLEQGHCESDHANEYKNSSWAYYKGGFVLPEKIKTSMIITVTPPPDLKFRSMSEQHGARTS
ncbi:MAG: hypothetical protein MMC33_003244 [Icmadophila ericetorum]|nr:hypothetical protein [Icmadophila ericetorum]